MSSNIAKFEKIDHVVQHAIETNKPIIFKTNSLLRSIEEHLFAYLKSILFTLEMAKLTEGLTYCLRELAANANRANLKRLFFIKNNLDINNLRDYQEGMKNFKIETFDDIDRFEKELLESNLYNIFVFETTDDYLIISIKNNALMTEQETSRVNSKIEAAWQYESIKEAMTEIMDSTEGAGLGITSIIMMAKKWGIDNKDLLTVKTNENETECTLKIPLDISN